MTFEDARKRSKRELDANQLSAICCDDRNCVVSAGAGSGKTTVLSYRFLRLVMDRKAHVDEILTLTFTRKAAAEMHERIHKQLLDCIEDPYVATELARFPNASISTLDSFCSRIVRADSTRYGIPSDFTTDDEACYDLAVLCANELIDSSTNDPGLVALVDQYAPTALVDEFLVPYAINVFTFSHEFDPDAAMEHIRQWATQQANSLKEEIQIPCAKIVQLGDIGGCQYTATTRKSVEELSKAIDAFEHGDLDTLGNLAMGNPQLPPSRKKSDEAVLQKAEANLLRVLVPQLIALVNFMRKEQHLSEIFSFLKRYQDTFLSRKRQGGILSFNDVATLAVDILKTNLQLRTYFKKLFKYIMIDEFQDNNAQQKDLLYLLAERADHQSPGIPATEDLDSGKLFFVGDEKQSIYRFRGADVSVFKSLKNELEGTGGVSLELTTNYRSEPYLIESFNTLFQEIMKNGGEPWEADFHTLGTRSPAPGVTPTITACVLPYGAASSAQEGEELGEDATSAESEGVHIANLIQEMLNTDGYLIPDGKGGSRRPVPSDIAILMRSGGSQMSYEKALRTQGIPYVLQEPRALMLESPSNDIYSMLQLCLYPNDTIAYAATLRSPFCFIGDRALKMVLDAYGKQEAPQPYCMDEQFLQALAMVLPVEDMAKYLRTAGLFQELQQRVGTQTLCEILSYLWFSCGYREYLLCNQSYQSYLEYYEFLWLMCRSHDRENKGLSDFLEYLRPLLGSNEKLTGMEMLHEEVGGVQIMSIHKSKGLEFPIVFIANSGSTGRPSASQMYPCEGVMLPNMDISNGDGKSVVHNIAENFQKDQRGAFERAELKRLLYVAMTRAKTHLVVSGAVTKNNHGKDSYRNNLLFLMLRAIGFDEETIAWNKETDIKLRVIEAVQAGSLNMVRSVAPNRGEREAWYGQAVDVVVDDSPLSVGITRLVGNHGQLSDADLEDAIQFDSLPSDPLIKEHGLEREFGTYVHALIQRMLESQLPDQGIESLRVSFPRGAGWMLSQGDFSSLLRDGLSLAKNFMESSLWEFLQSQPGAMSESEVPFYMMLDGQLANGVVDLLVTTPTVVYVVDFKTDTMGNPQLHEPQVRAYMEAMHRITSLPVRGTVCYLRKPGNEVWWEL